MIQIVFQNNNFIVCDKPAQVLSVPSRLKTDSRLCLGLELQNKLKCQVYPVHRLDYEVGGLIIYALNAKAHQSAQDWFLKKQIKKTYKAFTGLQDFSHWPSHIRTDFHQIKLEEGLEFNWKTQILRGKKRSFESSHGEWAETIAQVDKIHQDSVEWSLNPVTGKPHQLRLELSRHGFPIYGDSLYGSNIKLNQTGIALKAVQIELVGISESLGLPLSISLETPFELSKV